MITEINQKIKLVLEYDGTDFAGWQFQPSQRTVQGCVEQALAKLYGCEIRIHGAGRTDSGVHASGQTAHCCVNEKYSYDTIQKAVNFFLPEDVIVKSVQPVDHEFDARRSAKLRIYEYLISRSQRAVGRKYAWYPHRQFSLQLMKDASDFLLGEHDFTSFCRTGDEKGSFRTNIFNILWHDEGSIVRFEIHAVRYLHNMIRILIGTLMDVGSGKLTIEDFFRIFKAEDRSLAGKTAPPWGLYLKEVLY